MVGDHTGIVGAVCFFVLKKKHKTFFLKNFKKIFRLKKFFFGSEKMKKKSFFGLEKKVQKRFFWLGKKKNDKKSFFWLEKKRQEKKFFFARKIFYRGFYRGIQLKLKSGIERVYLRGG